MNFSHTQNVLVTGATSGIGRSIALHYASRGARMVAITGRRKEHLKAVALEIAALGAIRKFAWQPTAQTCTSVRSAASCRALPGLLLNTANVGDRNNHSVLNRRRQQLPVRGLEQRTLS